MSETGTSKVHILDSKFKKILSKKITAEWIQDAIYTPRGTILVADANNFTIKELTFPELKEVSSYSYEDNLKVFQIKILDSKEVNEFLN